MSEVISQRARDLYENAFVWDAHAGFTPDPSADLRQLNAWRDANVDFLSINVGFDLFPWEHTVQTIAAFRRWIAQNEDQLAIVRSVDDIARVRTSGRMAVTFDIEGMNALDGRIEMIEHYHGLGVRQMLFTYNHNNLAGGGCHDDDVGLTSFGCAAIDEMNRLGMFVDVSHCSYRTSMDVMAYSRFPVIFSHSNPRALCDHGRNIRDDQIRACAATGGVIGVVGFSRFLGSDARAETITDHVEYLFDVAGPGHVGIGLDYASPGSTSAPEDLIRENPQLWPAESYPEIHTEFAPPSRLLEVTDVLLARGHSEEVIRGFLGGNFLRLAGEVWGQP